MKKLLNLLIVAAVICAAMTAARAQVRFSQDVTKAAQPQDAPRFIQGTKTVISPSDQVCVKILNATAFRASSRKISAAGADEDEQVLLDRQCLFTLPDSYYIVAGDQVLPLPKIYSFYCPTDETDAKAEVRLRLSAADGGAYILDQLDCSCVNLPAETEPQLDLTRPEKPTYMQPSPLSKYKGIIFLAAAVSIAAFLGILAVFSKPK